MQYDYTQCVVLNARMAARAVSRRYDRKLKPYGITAAQFGIMGALARHGGESVTEISERLAMDRTTASRNLDLLVRKGLAESLEVEKGNVRACRLTNKGQALVDKLGPKWQEAQQELRTVLPDADLNKTLETLRALAQI